MKSIIIAGLMTIVLSSIALAKLEKTYDSFDKITTYQIDRIPWMLGNVPYMSAKDGVLLSAAIVTQPDMPTLFIGRIIHVGLNERLQDVNEDDSVRFIINGDTANILIQKVYKKMTKQAGRETTGWKIEEIWVFLGEELFNRFIAAKEINHAWNYIEYKVGSVTDCVTKTNDFQDVLNAYRKDKDKK